MNNEELNIENIIKCIQENEIMWTEHCLNRLNQRNISREDVKKAIITGTIIEYYYEDFPYKSCLILGRNAENKLLHVVCGMNNKKVYLITSYYPDKTKWCDDMKTRRKE